jgi:hypothetical protein
MTSETAVIANGKNLRDRILIVLCLASLTNASKFISPQHHQARR